MSVAADNGVCAGGGTVGDGLGEVGPRGGDERDVLVDLGRRAGGRASGEYGGERTRSATDGGVITKHSD